MPNAKVTFDRLWTTHLAPLTYIPNNPPADLPAFMSQYMGSDCQLPSVYNPYPDQIR
jgi:hypothetical protein